MKVHERKIMSNEFIIPGECNNCCYPSQTPFCSEKCEDEYGAEREREFIEDIWNECSKPDELSPTGQDEIVGNDEFPW